MNGAAAVQELQKIFKHKSLNDVSTLSYIRSPVKLCCFRSIIIFRVIFVDSFIFN